MRPIPLSARAEAFNARYPQIPPLVVRHKDGNPFLYGIWFVGGGNVSSFYGSYQVEYLKRAELLFSDAQKVVHLFSGSLPPSEKYTRVGIDYTGQHKSDFECDAHKLSSFLPFKPDLIYADPPYSVEDADHYKSGDLNRAKVVEECGIVLQPGGYLVWQDQALPVFSNNLLNLVGVISFIRSTGNRYRAVSIFHKPCNIK